MGLKIYKISVVDGIDLSVVFNNFSNDFNISQVSYIQKLAFNTPFPM